MATGVQMAKSVASRNFPPYLLSDAGRVDQSEPILCELSQAVVERTVTISETGTQANAIVLSSSDWPSERFRAMAERILQAVTSRQPKAFQPYPKQPDYLLAYVVETLACGHQQEYHFIDAVEPLTAKRRLCHECSGRIGALPLKKPVQSVRPEKEKAA